MSTNFPYFLSDDREEIASVRRNWGWVLALGLLLTVTGVLAISYPVLATLTTVTVFGVLLLIGGAIEFAGAFSARGAGSFFLRLICGLLAVFLGLVLLDRPFLGAAGYTLVMALFFFATGIARIVFALTHRFSGWGWVLLNGAISVALGVMIWQDFPEAALWVIGLFVGIDLVFNGLSWMILAVSARQVLKPAATTEPTLAQA